MTRCRYVLLFMFCMILFPNTSKADCSYERQAELSRMASNVQFSYNYEMGDNNTPLFTVNINNVPADIYIRKQNDLFGNVISNTSEYIESTVGGITLVYNIYSNDNNCRDEKILTQYLSIPYYNYYANSEECIKYPNFKYCQMWLNSSISLDEFNNSLEKYKSSQVNDMVIEEDKSLIDIITENINYILGIIAIFVILVIICVIRKIKKY